MGYERIVVKVGTSTVTRSDGSINMRKIDLLARVLSDLKNDGHDVILVTSGAIAVGRKKLGMRKKPASMAKRQAAAAIGQCDLMSVYDRYFMDYGVVTAQVLLTKDVFEHGDQKKNAIATFNALVKMGAIPIVNENDTIATEEIAYGDNDTLSAYVAAYTDADLLILLTDIDGLYDKDPKLPDAKRLSVVEDIDEAEQYALGAGSERGTGGMITKLRAARIAKAAGITTVIASSEKPSLLYEILEDDKDTGTWIPAGGN